ncbi:transcriptional regulator [bacterium]|nr:MAG: transcriptional regulator [bacterium]
MPEYCSRYHRASEMVGRRWAPSILRALLVRPHRFNELLHTIPGVSDRLLTERLRDLEEAGLVLRHVSTGRPVYVEYSLTEAGADLGRVVGALRDWAIRWMPPEGWPVNASKEG